MMISLAYNLLLYIYNAINIIYMYICTFFTYFFAYFYKIVVFVVSFDEKLNFNVLNIFAKKCVFKN